MLYISIIFFVEPQHTLALALMLLLRTVPCVVLQRHSLRPTPSYDAALRKVAGCHLSGNY